MDEHVLELLENLIDGRNDFFVQTMRLTPYQQRSAMMSRFMLNEVCYLEMISRIYRQRQIDRPVLTISVPADFTDNVPVLPSQVQIDNSLENVQSTTSNCAICQDSISSGGCKIRQCGHVYHRSCIVSWFALNVRCPVCRHDIRESGSVDQTQSDEE
jgi:hypothetical protein